MLALLDPTGRDLVRTVGQLASISQEDVNKILGIPVLVPRLEQSGEGAASATSLEAGCHERRATLVRDGGGDVSCYGLLVCDGDACSDVRGWCVLVSGRVGGQSDMNLALCMGKLCLEQTHLA